MNAAVGADAEPFGMLFDVGMVRRALEGEIEGDFDAVAAGGLDQRVEILERAKFRVNRFVAAFARADGPGTADFVERSLVTLFFPLR